MGHFVCLIFSFFVIGKEHNLQTDENIVLLHLKRKRKPNLSELTQVFCGLLSLLPKYILAKIKCLGAKYSKRKRITRKIRYQ